MEAILENNTGWNDDKIIEGIMGQSARALDELHKRYRTLLKSIIMQVLHDDSDAEDVLQEVFLQVWNRAHSYSSNRGKLVNWLCTLARRRAIDRLRQHSAYRRATDRYEVSCNHDDKEIDQIHTVEHEANCDDLKKLLDHHLEALPPQQQQAIRLAFLENRSQREISTLTHTPLGTVKTRIELGMKKLSHSIGSLRDKVL